ncbi:hypothetical protein [Streptomyces syringium]|uniref:hypothetical protein n=1 Tax=Streptomyces syringium TaxID=76729 RepID=UPI0033D9A062
MTETTAVPQDPTSGGGRPRLGHTATSAVTDWMSQAARSPSAALATWRLGEQVPLHTGRVWDLVEVDLELARGAMTELTEASEHVGPHLVSGMERAAWVLLPLGTSYRLAGLKGVLVHAAGWPLLAPPPGRYVGDRTWVLPGHGGHGGDEEGEPWKRLTPADALREAVHHVHGQRRRGKAARYR